MSKLLPSWNWHCGVLGFKLGYFCWKLLSEIWFIPCTWLCVLKECSNHLQSTEKLAYFFWLSDFWLRIATVIKVGLLPCLVAGEVQEVTLCCCVPRAAGGGAGGGQRGPRGGTRFADCLRRWHPPLWQPDQPWARSVQRVSEEKKSGRAAGVRVCTLDKEDWGGKKLDEATEKDF